ncbi:serine/threonine-protein kinase GRIK1-like isoform X1 [Trifolium pratense]|uniref:serine/threonine-protein kinase GRIK1-like isoform X1 n=1 Tax=Trifolium pratense TaxID=57577 RepID=UPI001E694677|nr:serine/threonine-protein kinase GRIK1-like isoform X1 [Trifolium pratense]
MLDKTLSYVRDILTCNCFGFLKKRNPRKVTPTIYNSNLSHELLLDTDFDDEDSFFNDEIINNTSGDDEEEQSRPKRSEEILVFRVENGMICRQFPVKETHKIDRTEDENGNKAVNEYVREYKIGSGSYGKVVSIVFSILSLKENSFPDPLSMNVWQALYRSSIDGKHYAIKAFHKSHLLKLRVAPSETAMTDVLREVFIMKMLQHPNIVNLIEVIDDPESDNFYMVLEYVEDKWVCDGSGRACSLGEETARRYLRDIVSGLMYLHAHNIVHGDIKPDNLLITRHGTVKIGDFSVSQAFEDDNDMLRRSPGTPVFTAPECILDITYSGKAADTWAVGVTLYCMVLGDYPFLGDTLQDTYDRIVNTLIVLPNDLNPRLKNLIEGLLCKDPRQRMTLADVAADSWVIGKDGPIPEYFCWCKRKNSEKEDNDESTQDASLTYTD